jgi:hypothetical protein
VGVTPLAIFENEGRGTGQLITLLPQSLHQAASQEVGFECHRVIPQQITGGVLLVATLKTNHDGAWISDRSTSLKTESPIVTSK